MSRRARALAAALAEHAHFLVHCQDVLINNVWGRMPSDWQKYLDGMSLLQLARLPLDHSTIACDAPDSLVAMLSMRELALERRPQNRSAEDDSAFVGVLRPSSKGARLAKKTHEVESLAALVRSVADAAGCSRVLDIGCGKGSLASQLAVVDGLHVVGLEAQETMASNAAKAAKKKAASAATSDTLPNGGSLRLWHRAIAADEYAPAVVDQICADAWPIGGEDVDAEESGGVLLCALHACGDLSSTITRCFAASPRCRAIALVPCCYNLLTVSEDPCGPEHVPMKCEP